MSIIKKVIIEKDELPAVDVVTRSYNVRYRLISEDRNRFSAWSKVYNLVTPIITPTTEFSIITNASHDLVTIAWNLDQTPEVGYFDIWVRWVGSHAESNYPWIYIETVTTNQYNLVYPTTIPDPVNGGTETPNKIRAAIQRAAYPKTKENYPTVSEITVFQTALETL